MGTRADFYVGGPDTLLWLGSIAYDGYPKGLAPELIGATDEQAYRAAVARQAADDDFTSPEQGWPWPWKDSQTTDYAYTFTAGAVYACTFGRGWWLATEPEPEGLTLRTFPDMTDITNIAWGKRSGLIILEGGTDDDDNDRPS